MKIIKTYVEQLRVPQKDIDITYKDFSDFREEYRTPSMDEINKTCEELYRRSKGNVDLMHEFERQLAELPKKHYRKRAEIFLKYIDTVKDKVDYRVLQALYERLVAACHLNCEFNKLITILRLLANKPYSFLYWYFQLHVG